jgi:hypothetical protein
MTRLEYLGNHGWSTGITVDLLHPERFPERLRAKGKFGRAITADGRIFVSPDVPADPRILRQTTEGFWPWKLPTPGAACPVCDVEHERPFDGSCLL